MGISRQWMKATLALSLLVILLALVPLAAMAAPPAQSNQPYVIIDRAPLNQRTGPGIQYAIQGTLPVGTTLPVIGRTANSSWWEVESDFGAGWINAEYTLAYGNFSAVPVVTEYGMIARPVAIVIGYPVEVRGLPNPGGRVLGFAPSEYEYPVFGRTEHTGTGTTWWLIMTADGLGWIENTGVGIYGPATNVPIISPEQAGFMNTAPVSGDGIIEPPAPTPVPSAPTVAPPAEPEPTEAAPAAGEDDEAASPDESEGAAEEAPAVEATTAAPVIPPVYQLRIAGDCYALPLVSFMLNRSPVYATGLDCSSTAAGRDAVLLGDADFSMAVDGTCGVAVSVPVAWLFDQDGASHSLLLCVPATPSTPTQTFLTWVQSTAGLDALSRYQGIANSNVPQYAIPYAAGGAAPAAAPAGEGNGDNGLFTP